MYFIHNVVDKIHHKHLSVCYGYIMDPINAREAENNKIINGLLQLNIQRTPMFIDTCRVVIKIA